jgi:phosphatidylglycerol lysyltransferase
MLASFCAYALGNTVGLGPLTGGAVRYRFYSAAGLQPGETARVVLFCALAFTLGIASVGGLGFVIAAPLLAELVRLPPFGVRLIGACLLSTHASEIATFEGRFGWILKNTCTLSLERPSADPLRWHRRQEHCYTGEASQVTALSCGFLLPMRWQSRISWF